MRTMMAGARLVVVAAFGLATVAAAADQPKVTPLMTKELTGTPGKEGTTSSRWSTRRAGSPPPIVFRICVYVLEGSVVMAVQGGQGSDAGTGRDVLREPQRRALGVPQRRARRSRPRSSCSW